MGEGGRRPGEGSVAALLGGLRLLATPRTWTLDFELWTLDFGLWTLDLELLTTNHYAQRPSLRHSNAAEKSRLHCGGRDYARTRHWREHGDFRSRERGDAANVASRAARGARSARPS